MDQREEAESTTRNTAMSEVDQQDTPHSPNAIVIVAKCPIPGKSKTRLSKSRGGILDDEGCAQMARAMLCDVIAAIHNCDLLNNVAKFVYHAPANEDGRRIMQDIFKSLDILCTLHDGEERKRTSASASIEEGCPAWNIYPMPDGGSGASLQSSDLGAKLSGMLEQTRTILRNRYNKESEDYIPAVAFLGMDSPELPLSEITYALELASRPHNRKAYLNPSHDGGYGMICLPPEAKQNVFEGISWSDPLTAVSQIKAVTDNGIDIELGSLMRDIDEADDLLEFAERLCTLRNAKEVGEDDIGVRNLGNDALVRPPPGRDIGPDAREVDRHCIYSWQAMVVLGMVDEDKASRFVSLRVARSRLT